VQRLEGGPDKARAVVAEMAMNEDPAKRSPFPSIKAFRAECRRISRVVRTARRKGPDAARQENYPVGAGPVVERAFQRVEADFKYLRLFVVDEESKMPLGTPFLMAVIDCYSGCIAGYDIGFDPPSYVSTARALKHVIGFKDMSAFGTNEDGEPLIRNAYPLNGVPFKFFVDNDQAFHSASFIRSAKALGCHVDYIPPSQSWKKGRIERFWGTVQECFLARFIHRGLAGDVF
jgi:putative transposase